MSQPADPDSTFLLTATDPSYRIPAFLGNGAFSLVSTPLGTSRAPSFAAGVYDRAPGDVPRIALLPAWNEFNLSHGAGWLNDGAPTPATLQRYRQTLDLYRGILRTTYDWIDGGIRTAIDLVAFVSRADPSLAVVHLQLTPHHAGRIRVAFPLTEWPAPSRLPLGRIEELPADLSRDSLWYPGHLVVTNRTAEAMTLQVEGGTAGVAVAQSVASPRGVPNLERTDGELAFDAVPGKPVSFTKYVGIAPSVAGEDPLPAARAAVERASAGGYRTALAAHAAAWKSLWTSDVIVEGDPRLQLVIHAMQFYLLSSLSPESGASLAPMGLSSAGFYGHIFWDADTWMLPPLAIMHPELARPIVDFRARTLEAARDNARANGYRGAMFPWEADERGEETTPRFAAQNARGEVHVTGDVALAQWQYYLATGDLEWLARDGYPVIREAAEFWVSRVSRDETSGRYHIRDVVSVDESLIGVDDDAYTNAVARRNLEIALAGSLKLGRTPNPEWAAIAAGLEIPYDPKLERHCTYQGARPTTRSSAVPLLAYPLGLPMSEQVKRNDLMHTVGQLGSNHRAGAMMSHVLYPVVAAELGDQGLIDRLLPLTYEDHLRAPFSALAERPIDDGVNFITGAGAFLQQVVFGYTGLRLLDDGLRAAFKPMLPSSIRRIVLRNVWVHGVRQDIIVDREAARFVGKVKAA